MFCTKVSVDNGHMEISMKYSRDKVALRTTWIKNAKCKIVIKIRTGCQYVDNLYYGENLNWAAQNL